MLDSKPECSWMITNHLVIILDMISYMYVL